MLHVSKNHYEKNIQMILKPSENKMANIWDDYVIKLLFKTNGMQAVYY